MELSNFYKPLGSADITLSPVGLGTWQFSGRKNLAGRYWPSIPFEEQLEIVKVSIEEGVNWFDTAELYGKGESERNLSNALISLGQEQEVFIATKWWPLFRRSGSIIKTVDRRLAALHNLPISLYQIHQPYSFSSIQSQMKAMATLVNEHKIKYIGVSNFSARQMEKAHNELDRHGIRLVSNQVNYSLLDRKIETNGILDTARRLGIAVIAYSPLAQGILSGKFHRDPDLVKKQKGFRRFMPKFKQKFLADSMPVIKLLENLALKYEVKPSQLALNWLINYNGGTVFAIPGASNAAQARDNAHAMKLTLQDHDVKELDNVSKFFK